MLTRTLHLTAGFLLLCLIITGFSSPTPQSAERYSYCNTFPDRTDIDNNRTVFVSNVFAFSNRTGDDRLRNIREAYQDLIQQHGWDKYDANCSGASSRDRSKVVESRRRFMGRMNRDGIPVRTIVF